MSDSNQKFIEVLLEKRAIYLSGEITSEVADLVGKVVIYLNASGSGEIRLYINSNGGSVPAGLDIFDMIRHSKAPICGVVYRQASSIAAIILQACKKRVAMPNSELSIHFPTVKPYRTWELVDEQRLLEIIEEVKKTNISILSCLKRTGRTESEILDQLKKNRIMSATEALDFGLIDEVSCEF